MRVLAIDQGSRFCGFAVGVIAEAEEDPSHDKAISRLLNHGRIVDQTESLIGRLTMLRVAFKSLIEQYRPDVVVVEDIYYASLPTKQTIYAMAGVTLMAEMAAADCLVAEFEKMNASTVRKILGIRPGKTDVEALVSRVFGLPDGMIKDDNHADALGLLLAYAIKRRTKGNG